MVQIVGKYQNVSSSPDFEGYLRALGTPEETLKPFLESKPTIDISETAGTWTIAISNAGKTSSSTFKLGEAYDETMPHGLVVKSVTKREGDKFITESALDDGRGGKRIYEFTDAGITVHLSAAKTDKTATRVYKRI